jgi:hypothetical protein
VILFKVNLILRHYDITRLKMTPCTTKIHSKSLAIASDSMQKHSSGLKLKINTSFLSSEHEHRHQDFFLPALAQFLSTTHFLLN